MTENSTQLNVDKVYNVQGSTEYIHVLTQVQEHMSSSTFDTHEMGIDDIFRYKKNIESFITQNKIQCNGVSKLSELVDKLYNSMVLYDVLTPYLEQKTYKTMGIEEIYGRWDCIYLLTKKGKIRLQERFPSAEVAKNILTKMAEKFNANINEGTPTALGEFMPNIRLSIVSSPITSSEHGTEFNIRIVHGSDMQRKLLIDGGTISEKGLDFLELCIKHKVNICIAGATGSGKTGTMYYLLTKASETADTRVGTVEIECREFDLVKYDEDGNVINDVFHWVSRNSADERYNITANNLIEIILRFKPDVVGIGEMRNAEALTACEIGITGHGLISTIHSKNAKDTYSRIVMLCKKANLGYDDKTLYELALKAFPIIVYQKQCADKSRKIFEIIEGVGYESDRVNVNPLFNFVVQDNLEADGKMLGFFRQVGNISDELRKEFIDNGASVSTMDKFRKEV